MPKPAVRRVKIGGLGTVSAIALDVARDRAIVLVRGFVGRVVDVVVVALGAKVATKVVLDGPKGTYAHSARGLALLGDGRVVTSVHELDEKKDRERASPWILDVDAKTVTVPKDAPWYPSRGGGATHAPIRLSDDGRMAWTDLNHVASAWKRAEGAFAVLQAKGAEPPPDRATVERGVLQFRREGGAVVETLAPREVTSVLDATPAGIVALGGYHAPCAILDANTRHVVVEKPLFKTGPPVASVDRSANVAVFGDNHDLAIVTW